jgi:hypothetical protein
MDANEHHIVATDVRRLLIFRLRVVAAMVSNLLTSVATILKAH